MSAPASARLGRVALVAALVLVCGLAWVARVEPARDWVLPPGGEVELLGPDAWFHLRHARSALEHHPRLQRFDVGAGYPTGEPAWHAGLLHVGMATVAKALGGARTLERVAAWTPPVLGVLSVLALFGFARASMPAAGAAWAAALYVLHPGRALDRTTLGATDHHAAEILLLVGSAAAVHHLLVRESARPGGRPYAAPAMVASLPLAAFAFTWLGAPLHFGLVGVAIAAVWIVAVAVGEDATPTARAGMRLGAGALLWIAGTAALVPSSVMRPDLLPALLGGCAALSAGCVLGGVLERAQAARGLRRGMRVALLVGLATAPVLLAFAASPALRVFAAEALRPKAAQVEEHRALVFAELLHTHGAAAPLALVGAIAVAVAVLRRRAPAHHSWPVVLGLGVLALVWRTHDYEYVLAPFVALLAAQACVAFVRAAGNVRGRAMGIVALVGLLLAPHVLFELRRPWVPSEHIAAARVADPGWRQATAFLREHTPKPSLPVHAQPERPPSGDLAYPAGTWGVMAAWDRASLVAALGERPVVVAGRPDTRAAAFLLAGDEGGALGLLCPDCRGPEHVRYVVVSATTAADHFLAHASVAGLAPETFRGSAGTVQVGAHPRPLVTYGPRYEAALVTRLMLHDGDGFEQMRLVFESRQQSGIYQHARQVGDGVRARRHARRLDDAEDEAALARLLRSGVVATPDGWAYDAHRVASVKVFEVVPGARITGKAAAAGRVVASLALETGDPGRRFVHRVQTRTDAEGGFGLRVPYQTETPMGETRPLGPWQVRVPGAAADLAVPVTAEQVRSGSSIRLPVP